MAILKQEAAITEYMCSWCGKTVKQTRGEGCQGIARVDPRTKMVV